MENEIEVTQIYRATSPLLGSVFKGEVTAIHERTCVMRFVKWSEEDAAAVYELHGMIVVSKEVMELVE